MLALLSLKTEISDLGDRAIAQISNLSIASFLVCSSRFIAFERSTMNYKPRTLLTVAAEEPAAELAAELAAGCCLVGEGALDCKPEGCCLADRRGPGCKLEVACRLAHDRAREHQSIGGDDLYLYLCQGRELVGHRRLLDGNDLVGRTRLVPDLAGERAGCQAHAIVRDRVRDTGHRYSEAR